MTKKNKNQKKYPTIEEAIGNRAIDPGVKKALDEAQNQIMAEQQPPIPTVPHTETASSPPVEEENTTTNPPQGKHVVGGVKAEMMKETLPVSKTDPQPEQETSTPELVETPKESLNLRRLREFVSGEEYNQNWVLSHLSRIGSVGAVAPRIATWRFPNETETIAEAVYRIVTERGYVDAMYPSLEIIMDRSVDNVYWSAAVLTSMAFFDYIKMLPFLERL